MAKKTNEDKAQSLAGRIDGLFKFAGAKGVTVELLKQTILEEFPTKQKSDKAGE